MFYNFLKLFLRFSIYLRKNLSYLCYNPYINIFFNNAMVYPPIPLFGWKIKNVSLSGKCVPIYCNLPDNRSLNKIDLRILGSYFFSIELVQYRRIINPLFNRFLILSRKLKSYIYCFLSCQG